MNGEPVPRIGSAQGYGQAGVCEMLAAGGVRRSTGRTVVTGSQWQREGCASLVLCGANVWCSILSSLIWSAEDCGAELVENLSAYRAHHPRDLYALGKFCPASCGQNLACAACRRSGPACDVVLDVVVRTTQTGQTPIRPGAAASGLA